MGVKWGFCKHIHVRIERGGGARGPDPPPPWKITKHIGFLSNTGRDSLKNHKATKPEFHFGDHQAASETPFKWHFAGGPLMTR